jgi:hypothetical protein
MKQITSDRVRVKHAAEKQRSGDALTMALAYAARGWLVFPVPPGTKKSYVSKKTKWGSGANWGATKDPILIGLYWSKYPRANVGVVTGPDSDLWVMETDSRKGHKGLRIDGEVSLRELEDEHGKLPDTLTGISPSGSRHYYYKWPDDLKDEIRNSTSVMGIGIDVRGFGGMVVAPPSIKPDVGAYRWINNLPIADAPQWLVKAAIAASKRIKVDTATTRPIYTSVNFNSADALQDLEDACTELAATPEGSRNDTLNFVAFHLGQLIGGGRLDEALVRAKLTAAALRSGLDAYGVARTIESGVGAGIQQPRLLVGEAWQEHLQNEAVNPAVPVEIARKKIRKVIQRFLDSTTAGRVHAMRATTGSGKTEIAIELLSIWLAADRKRTVLFLVPRHDLAEDIVKKFTGRGTNARVYYGREADDPQRPGKKMCWQLPRVRTAIRLGRNVEKACCHCKFKDGSEQICEDFGNCGFVEQCDDQPQVWVAAHNLLFFEQKKLFRDSKGRPSLVIIDESFYKAGLREFELRYDKIKDLLFCDVLRAILGAHIKNKLPRVQYDVLKRGVPFGRERRRFGVDEMQATIGHIRERMRHPSLYPGMQDFDAAYYEDTHAETYGKAIGIYKELINILQKKIKVSGRVRLGGSISVNTLSDVSKQWRGIPTLLFDATLPGLEILKKLYPKVRIVADLNVAAPHARVRQIINAPVAASKLKSERRRQELLRYILRRWVECGRGKTLIVAQGHKCPKSDEDYNEWWAGLGADANFADWLLKPGRLPSNIHVEHFNAISGNDDFGDVRLLICVGRTEPTALAMESEGGAVRGVMPETVAGPGNWSYPRKDYEIARGKVMSAAYHPDPLVQECLDQACAAGIIQAIGRARAVNRSAGDPVEIDVLCNVFLPLAPDRAEPWQAPGAFIEIVRDGLGVDSARDLARAWPHVWANERAAKRALQALGGGSRRWFTEGHFSRRWFTEGHFPIESFPLLLYRGLSLCETSPHAHGDGAAPRLLHFRYQHLGGRQKWRNGWYDPAVVPDPRAWLEARLGCELRVEYAA